MVKVYVYKGSILTTMRLNIVHVGAGDVAKAAECCADAARAIGGPSVGAAARWAAETARLFVAATAHAKCLQLLKEYPQAITAEQVRTLTPQYLGALKACHKYPWNYYCFTLAGVDVRHDGP